MFGFDVKMETNRRLAYRGLLIGRRFRASGLAFTFDPFECRPLHFLFGLKPAALGGTGHHSSLVPSFRSLSGEEEAEPECVLE